MTTVLPPGSPQTKAFTCHSLPFGLRETLAIRAWLKLYNKLPDEDEHIGRKGIFVELGHRKRHAGLNKYLYYNDAITATLPSCEGDIHKHKISLNMQNGFTISASAAEDCGKNLKSAPPTHKIASCPSIYFDLIEGVLEQCSRNSSTKRTFKLCKNERQWFKSINLT